jgi:hypothetical protein
VKRNGIQESCESLLSSASTLLHQITCEMTISTELLSEEEFGRKPVFPPVFEAEAAGCC